MNKNTSILKLKNYLISDELNIRHRLMNIINISTVIAALSGMFYSIALNDGLISLIPTIFSVVSLILSFIILNVLKNPQLAGIILSCVCNGVLFPCMVFFSGGIHSGTPIWMMMGFIYNFLIITGAASYILTGIAIIIDGACFCVAYLHPEYVILMDSTKAEYIDVFLALVLTSLIFGIIFKYQTYVYEKQKNKLIIADSAKSELLANVSHEIRTPINSIIGMNEMILRKSTNSEITEYSRTIDSAGNTLLALINDLLDMSKIEAGKMILSETVYDLPKLLEGCINMVKVRAENKGLKLSLNMNPNLPCMLKGDDVRIIQMINNLLTNAIKYTDKGEVSLNADCTQSEEGFILDIGVTDTGRGISEEDKKNLFDSFTRIDIKRNRNIEGTGLGLTITKQFATMMNGSIEVDSSVGNGSTFTIHIPQQVVDKHNIGETENCSFTSEKEQYVELLHAPNAKLLIVDDVALNREIIQLLLEKTEIQIDQAEDGYKCLDMVKKNNYDIIFMDQMMPGIDGLETIKAIRQMDDNQNKDIPIILVTANAGLDKNMLLKEAGCNEYLTKPVDGKLLENTIFRFLPKEKIEILSQST